MEDHGPQKRAPRKKLRITFPDGNVLCYTDSTATMLAALAKIGKDRFPEIKLEIGGHPIITQQILPKYKAYMREICDGWYLNTQSDNACKYMQMKAINDTLGLGLKVEVGTDFKARAIPDRAVRHRTKETLRIHFPEDDTYIALESPQDGYLEAVRKIGINKIVNRRIPYKSYTLATRVRESSRQLPVDDCWIYIPGSIKDKALMLRTIALCLRIPLDVSIV